jgi:hypothetical protein
MNKVTSTAIAPIEVAGKPVDLTALFTGNKVDGLIEKIRAEVTVEAPDTSSAKGRKRIKSLAYKVAQTKTALDKAGAALVEDAKRQVDTVNAERRKLREGLDALRDEVRKPADDWEAAEALRVSLHRGNIDLITGKTATHTDDPGDISAKIESVNAICVDDTWDEFESEARAAKEAALSALEQALLGAHARVAQEEELQRLRDEAAAREAEAAERRADEEKAEAERLAEKREEDRRIAALDAIKGKIADAVSGQINGRTEPVSVRIHEVSIIDPHMYGAQSSEILAAKDRALRSLRAERAVLKGAEAKRAEAEAITRAAQIAADQKRREDERRAKALADKAKREKIRSEIQQSLSGVRRADLAEHIMSGQVPHLRVVA